MRLPGRALSVIGLGLLLSGCMPDYGSGPKSSASSPSAVGGGSPGSTVGGSTTVSATGLEAFKTGFYAFANQQGCVKCHGSIVHPTFAAPDINVAYAAAKGPAIGVSDPLINFNNPSQALFITYAGNSHCNDTPCSDPSVRPHVQELLTAWANAELASSGGSSGGGTAPAPAAVAKYLTMSMPMPSTIPAITAKTPAVIRFQLSALNPAVASLNKAVLELEVQLVNATEYRIARPKLVGASAAVNITGIHVYLRPSTTSGIGTEDTAQGNLWDMFSGSAPVVALPNPLPTGPMTATPLTTTVLNIQAQSSSDVITVGFDNLQ